MQFDNQGHLLITPKELQDMASTKIGFSIKPKVKKVWMEYGPPSDLDLAIVDTNFFHIVDYEVGRWEWNPDNRGKMFRNQRLFAEYRNRVYQKGKYDCFRFFDLPKIPSMARLYECLESAPVEACCGLKRSYGKSRKSKARPFAERKATRCAGGEIGLPPT